MRCHTHLGIQRRQERVALDVVAQHARQMHRLALLGLKRLLVHLNAYPPLAARLTWSPIYMASAACVYGSASHSQRWLMVLSCATPAATQTPTQEWLAGERRICLLVGSHEPREQGSRRPAVVYDMQGGMGRMPHLRAADDVHGVDISGVLGGGQQVQRVAQ